MDDDNDIDNESIAVQTNRGWIIESLSRIPLQSERTNRIWTRFTAHWIVKENILLFRLAVPIFLTLFFQQILLLISLVFVGQINKDDDESLYLDAAVLGSSFANITGLSIGIGISTASDTLSAQTHGSGNYKQLGVILQRGLLIALFLCIFITCIWLNTESILLLLQQNPCVAKNTASYVEIFILALPPALLYFLLQKYLQTQNIVWIFVISGFLANIVSIVVNAVFISGLHFGLRGASGALVIANIFQPLAVILYIKIRKLHTKTWGGWSFKSLEGWIQYLRLGIPGMFMICIEWVSFEIAAIVLGTISKVELAVHGIIISYMSVIFMLPLGVGIAASFRVGNELGAGNPQGAKRASCVAVGITVINAIVITALTQAIKNYLGHFFNAEDEVNHKLKSVLDLTGYTLFFLADQTQAVFSGILRGAGHQLRGAIINLIAFYIFGLPTGITLALVLDMGAFGMWIGLIIAVYVQSLSSLIFLLCMNWTKEAKLAMERGGGKNADGPMDNDTVNTVLVDYQPLLTQGDDEHDDNGDGDTMMINDTTIDDYDKDVCSNDRDHAGDTSVGHGDTGGDHSDTSGDHGDASGDHGDTSSADHSDAGSDAGNNLSDNTDSAEMYLLSASDVSKFGRFLIMLKSRSKLIVSHSILLTIALVTLVLAGIGSHYHPPDYIFNGNYSECSNNDSILL